MEKVVIIGAGPAGLTAAIYCARAGLSPLVAAGSVNGNLLPGGQLMTTTEVENYPGFPDGISGPDLIDRFHRQATRFGAKIVNEWATDIDTTARPFKLKVGDQPVTTDVIIIATGAVAKWLSLPDEDKFKNNGVSACATCDGPLPCFRNQELHVVGGGDTAMEEAMFLTRFASKVIIVHRRDSFRASKVMLDRAMANPKIEFLMNSEIVGYHGTDTLEVLRVKNTVNGETSTHKTGGLFMGIGHEPVTSFLKGTSIALDSQGYIREPAGVTRTNVPGVFTCGDVHDCHYRQAVTAAGFGCMAALEAERWLEQGGK